MKFGTELYGLRNFLFTTVLKTKLNPILSFPEGSELLSAVVKRLECQYNLHLVSWLSMRGAILNSTYTFSARCYVQGKTRHFEIGEMI